MHIGKSWDNPPILIYLHRELTCARKVYFCCKNNLTLKNMKKIPKGLSAAACTVSAIMAAAAATSCVNEEYDFSDGIDTTVGISGEIGAPLGSTENLVIGDFLEIGDGTPVVSDPETGDYSIHLEAVSPFTDYVEIDRITIGADNLLQNGWETETIDLYNRIKNQLGQYFPEDQDISSYRLEDSPAFPDGSHSVSIIIDEDVSEIAESVKAIGVIEVRIPIRLMFTIQTGKLFFNKGFSISFPEYMTIEAGDDSLAISVDNGHVVRFDEGFEADSDSKVDFSLDILSVDVKRLQEDTRGTQGLVGGHIIVDQNIVMDSLTFDAVAGDFGKTLSDMPQSVDISVGLEAESVDVISASAVVDPDIEIEPQSVELGEMPEFLTGEDIVLDVFNPVISLDILNSSPFSVLFSARLNGLDADGNFTLQEPVAVGSADIASPDAILVGPGSTAVRISARGSDFSGSGPAGGTNPAQDVIVPDLPLLLRQIPDRIAISDIRVIFPHEGNQADGYADSDYTELVFPEDGSSLRYDFSIDYDIDIPLSFGSEMRLHYPYDITGLNEAFGGTGNQGEGNGNDLTVSLNEADIDFTLVNAIPFEMTVAAEPLDIDGNVLESVSGLSVEIFGADGTRDARAAAGDIGQESASPMTVRVRADADALKRLDGFRLDMSASVPESHEGRCLNSGQYIRLDDISVMVNGEVTIK